MTYLSCLFLLCSEIDKNSKVLSPRERLILEWSGVTEPLISFEQIIESCEAALKKKSHTRYHADFLLRLADAFEYTNKNKKSAEASQRALKLRPGDPEALWRVGRAKLGAQELGEALDLAEQLIKAHPGFARGYFLLAGYHLEKRKFKETIALCDIGLKKDPDFTMGYVLRGYAHFFLKSFDKSLLDVSAARSKAPMGGRYDIALLELQAGTYFSLGRFREAEGMYVLAVLVTQQKKAESCVLLWRCYGQLGKFGSSLALAKDFENALPPWLRARSFAQAGLLELAEQELQKTIKTSPGSVEALTTEALIRYLQGKHKDALLMYVKATKLKLAPMVADTGLRGAFILATCPDAKIRDPKNAKDIAKMCLEKLNIPEDKQEALVVLAIAKAAAGEFSEAIKDLEESVKLETSNKRITRACQELKRLFQRRRQYYYDPLMAQQRIFALDPARIITDPN